MTILIPLWFFQSAAHEQYPFSSKQQEAVDTLLADSLNSRLVMTSDCTNQFLEDYRQETPGYLPYFCEGDFNEDGIGDFIIALKTGDRYDIYLFIGYHDGSFRPHWFASLNWLHDAGFFNRSGRPSIGMFYSDVVIRFYWNREKGQFDAVEEKLDE
ncbi:MAG: hypothetical protein HUU10_07245 [Bacteroidetes bacterium]|nr:hypothetical protein [Bacteroidota bacterium]